MTNLTKEIIEDFLRNNQIELAPTQMNMCVPVINRIYKKMSAGIHFSEIKVEGKLICEGHHRYIASLFANYPLGRISGVTTSATTVRDWKSIVFETDDWDTSAKVRMLNEQDAEFNNIPIERLVELLR